MSIRFNGTTTVNETVPHTVDGNHKNGTHTVKLPDFLLILFDQDQLHTHTDKRMDVNMDDSEHQMLDYIANDQAISRQGALRVALRYLYSNYNREIALNFRRENRRKREPRKSKGVGS